MFLSALGYVLFVHHVITLQALTPLETYFFNNQSLIESYIVKNDANAKEKLSAMFQGVDNTDTLLEMRIIQPFQAGTTPTGPLNDSQIGGWFLWRSVNAWLNRPSLYNDSSLEYLSTEYFGVSSYFEGCHYCDKSFTELPVTAHFSNDQSMGAYPIEATFAVFLVGWGG